jgi:hypothetical protein
MISLFGMSEQRSKKLQRIPYIEKMYQFSYDTLLNSGLYVLAPGLRQIVEKYPKLRYSHADC